MNGRLVLDQRRATLAGLLDAPSGPLGPNAGELGQRLAQAWETELRLIDRLLGETPGDDVLATITAWRERTQAFAERSPSEPATWTDKQGMVWDADQVLGLLGELSERVERWGVGGDPVAAGNDNAATSGGRTDAGPQGETP